MATTDSKLYIALGILAVLGGALYLANQREKEEAKHYSLEGSHADLPKLSITDDDIKQVTRITLHKPGGDAGAPVDIVMTKSGDDWSLEKPLTAPADQANVKSLLDNLKTLKLTELIDPSKSSYKEHKLDEDSALHLVVDKGETSILDAYFGESGGRGQMTRLADHDGAYAVKGYSSYLYGRDVKGWRDLGIFKFEEGDVTQIQIENENGRFSFEKADNKWTGKFGKGKAGPLLAIPRFEESKVRDMIRAYKSLNADNYNADGKSEADAGLDTPTATIEITLKDGAKRSLEVGASAEGTSRWVKASGKDEILSISSWAADWGIANADKFAKKEEKKDDDAGDDDKGPAKPAEMGDAPKAMERKGAPKPAAPKPAPAPAPAPKPAPAPAPAPKAPPAAP